MDAVRGRDDPWSVWARGVCVMATGDYHASIRALRRVADDGNEVGGLACATIASGLRQIDEHARAVEWDERALASAGRGVVDGLIGRVADDVGLLRTADASRRLEEVGGRLVDSRDRVRFGWVSTEVALLRGDPATALAIAEETHVQARKLGSPRHIVKSTLFLGVCLVGVDPARAREVLRDALAAAIGLRVRPLVWPIVIVLGGTAGPAERDWGREAVGFIDQHLPAGLGGAWRERADLGQLLG